MNDRIVGLILGMNSSVLMGLVLYVSLHKPEMPLQVVDIAGVIQQEVQHVAALKLSDSQRQQRADQFSQALSKSIHEAASTFSGPILVAAAVVQGGEDRTEWVKLRMKHWISVLPQTAR
ncbi:MAG: TrbI F-type domain-containing protein [Pseudomonadales bacterium]|nr:TrbI F-type domain-containing protein [Pseudomonadales bacterium]